MQIFTKHSFPANSISQCPLTFPGFFFQFWYTIPSRCKLREHIYIFIYMGYFLYYLHRVRGQYNFVQINWIAIIEFIYLQAYLQTDKIIRQTESLLGLLIWYRWLHTVFLYNCQWTYRFFKKLSFHDVR